MGACLTVMVNVNGLRPSSVHPLSRTSPMYIHPSSMDIYTISKPISTFCMYCTIRSDDHAVTESNDTGTKLRCHVPAIMEPVLYISTKVPNSVPFVPVHGVHRSCHVSFRAGFHAELKRTCCPLGNVWDIVRQHLLLVCMMWHSNNPCYCFSFMSLINSAFSPCQCHILNHSLRVHLHTVPYLLSTCKPS